MGNIMLSLATERLDGLGGGAGLGSLVTLSLAKKRRDGLRCLLMW